MEQGFIASEFAPAAAAKDAQAAFSRATRGGHAPAKPHNPSTAHSAAEATAKGTALYGHVAKGERKAEEGLRNVQSKLMMPAMLQFGGMILATPLMWATKKLPRVKTVIGSVFKASGHALENTKITELGQLPANYMSAVAEQASEAGATQWAAGATAKSATLKVSGEAAQGKAAEFMKPVMGAISSAIEKISQSGFAKAMPNAVKSSLGKVRGASVFQVLMTTGVAVGMAATLVGARAEKKETKAAFDGLLADIGGDSASPFAKAVKATYASKKKWGAGKTGIELVGGVVEGVMWAKPGFGGMAMMGALMVPQLCSSLVPESPVLGGYVALSKADAGELKLDTAARTDLVKQLIAIVPNVAKNGGPYNRLVTPIAKELVSKNMTAKQVVQLLNDDAAFTKLASDISAKQEATKGAGAANDAYMGREPVKAVAKETRMVGTPEAASAPKLQISGAKMHHGTVAANQLQVG